MKKFYLIVAISLLSLYVMGQPPLNRTFNNPYNFRVSENHFSNSYKYVSDSTLHFPEALWYFFSSNGQAAVLPLWPDSLMLYNVDTTGGTPFKWWIHGFADILDPDCDVLENYYGYNATQNTPFHIDSVRFWYVYDRQDTSVVDTLKVYVVEGSDISLTNFMMIPPNIYPSAWIPYDPLTNGAMASPFVTEYTILLDNSYEHKIGTPGWGEIGIGLVDTIDAAGGDKVGIVFSYIPGQSYNLGDTLFKNMLPYKHNVFQIGVWKEIPGMLPSAYQAAPSYNHASQINTTTRYQQYDTSFAARFNDNYVPVYYVNSASPEYYMAEHGLVFWNLWFDMTVVASPDDTICPITQGGFATLSAEVSGAKLPISYSWTPTAGLTTPTAQSTNAFPSTTTTYTVQAIDANNDTVSDQVTITIGAINIEAWYLGTPVDSVLIACGDSVILSGQITGNIDGGVITTWNNGDTTLNSVVEPGTYIITVANVAHGCWDKDTIVVYDNGSVNADFTDSKGVDIMTADFANSSTGATGYLWDFGDGGFSTNAAPSHTYIVPATYTVALKAMDASNCSHTVYKQVTVPYTTGINNLDLYQSVTIYPNPSRGNLQINYENKTTKADNISIYDMQGKRVFFEKIDNIVYQKNVSLLNYFNGLYLIKIQTEKGVINKKVALIH